MFLINLGTGLYVLVRTSHAYGQGRYCLTYTLRPQVLHCCIARYGISRPWKTFTHACMRDTETRKLGTDPYLASTMSILTHHCSTCSFFLNQGSRKFLSSFTPRQAIFISRPSLFPRSDQRPKSSIRLTHFINQSAAARSGAGSSGAGCEGGPGAGRSPLLPGSHRPPAPPGGVISAECVPGARRAPIVTFTTGRFECGKMWSQWRSFQQLVRRSCAESVKGLC